MTTAPITPATEYDDTIVDGGQNIFQNHPWLSLAGLIIVAILAFWAYSIWNFERQLPAAFVARPNDSVMTYVTATKDPVKRVLIAIAAAERTRQPIYATELCGVSAEQRVPGTCGTLHRVSYKEARKLARYTDTVLLDVPLQPGDFMDARKGVFTPAARRVNVVDPVVVTGTVTSGPRPRGTSRDDVTTVTTVEACCTN